MERVTAWLLAFKTWVDGADWRSWLVHTILAWPIMLAFGWKAMAAFFLLRELEQLAFELMERKEPKWVDHFFDVFVPAFVMAWL